MDEFNLWREKIRLQARAHQKVKLAIFKRRIAKLDGSIKCSDCSEMATQYDHRDYSKPLEVSPVCRACNVKRGSSIDVLALYSQFSLKHRGKAK